MTATSPQACIREAIQLLSFARHGKTASGQPARILTTAELEAVAYTLARAIDELETQVVVDDPLPFVAWGTKNFGEWHRQLEENTTRCGVPVPINHARTCYRPGTAPRPSDYCKKCWAPAPLALPTEVGIVVEMGS